MAIPRFFFVKEAQDYGQGCENECKNGIKWSDCPGPKSAIGPWTKVSHIFSTEHLDEPTQDTQKTARKVKAISANNRPKLAGMRSGHPKQGAQSRSRSPGPIPSPP